VINASALQLLLALLTGWLDRREREVPRYLVQENRVLRRQLRGRRLQLPDDDRRRLAGRAYRLVLEASVEPARRARGDSAPVVIGAKHGRNVSFMKGDRKRCGRGLHGRAANRFADDALA
jgi:hypothetical protein